MTTPAFDAPIRCEELGSAEVLASVGPYTACVDDPPWTPISPTLAVCALALIRGNEPDPALDTVSAADTRADRVDLEIEERMFHDRLIGSAAHSRAEDVDGTGADVLAITSAVATRVWELVPRLTPTGGG